MSDSDSHYDIPGLAEYPFQPIPSQSAPIGSRIMYYLTNKVKAQVPEEFKDNCTLLDNLREQLRTMTEMTIDSLKTLVDYNKLLTTLLDGLDYSEAGVGLTLSWNKVVQQNPDFDITCFCWNCSLLLLKYAMHLNINTNDVEIIIKVLKNIKGLIDKMLELHKTTFEAAISEKMIHALSSYLSAYVVHAQFGLVIVKNQRKTLIGKVSKLAANEYRSVVPPKADIAQYFDLMALIYTYQGLAADQSYGKALSLARKIPTFFPEKEKDLKKLISTNPFFKDWILPLRTRYASEIKKHETDNASIYHDTVPTFEDIVPLKKQQIESSLSWESTLQVCGLKDSISDKLKVSIDERIEVFQDKVSKAIADLDIAIALYPAAKAQEMHEMVTQLYAKRTLVLTTSDSLSKIIGQRMQAISAKNPQAINRFNNLRRAIDQATQTDLFFETNLGKASSLITNMKTIKENLEGLKTQILTIQSQTKLIVKEVEDTAEQTSLDTILASTTAINNKLDDLVKQINPIFAQVSSGIESMKQEADKNVPPYTSETETVKSGFTQGITCYDKVQAQLNQINDQVQAC